MDKREYDANFYRPLKPREAAEFMRVSLSWLDKNTEKLNARRMGKTLIFPCKAELYESVFRDMES